jgi:murein DD-endopeptidase MepM/ murein hydrolase activator NlpD
MAAERVQGVYGAVRDQLWVGVGRRFQPVPRAQLVRGSGDGLAALLPAAPGTPVHAVEAGTVADLDGEGGIALLGDDGWRQHYAGLDPDGITVPVGAAVRAGAILGSVSGRGRVEVRISDDSGRPVDAVEVLIGLPDPGELGVVAVGEGLGVDPDDLDRELAPEDISGWSA